MVFHGLPMKLTFRVQLHLVRADDSSCHMLDATGVNQLDAP
jgi:hypothetical protein